MTAVSLQERTLSPVSPRALRGLQAPEENTGIPQKESPCDYSDEQRWHAEAGYDTADRDLTPGQRSVEHGVCLENTSGRSPGAFR